MIWSSLPWFLAVRTSPQSPYDGETHSKLRVIYLQDEMKYSVEVKSPLSANKRSPDLSDKREIILAQEQSVVHKMGFMREAQGTLILTNKRLIFVAANQEIDFRVSYPVFTPASMEHFRFADVEDLDHIPEMPENFSITIDEIEIDKGEEHFFENPHLKIRWLDNGSEKKAEFIADSSLTGRKIDLKDWTKVIDSLKNGTIKITFPTTSPPSKDTLEGKVLYILGDMQDKGLLEIEQQTEEYFKVELEPDEVEAACRKLVSMGFLDRVESTSGDSFYRKRSPLGKDEDDLSSWGNQ